MAQMLKHATEKPAPLAAFVDDLPPGFQQALDRFLAKAPASRYQTPAEASEALRPFVHGGAPVVAADMVPAFKDWLASESAMEMPKGLLQTKAPTAPAVKPGTGPSPTLSPAAKPTAKTGTAPAPALKSGAIPQPTKPAVAVPARPTTMPIPVAVPPQPVMGEVNVELVTDLVEASQIPTPAPPPERPVWPPDRRDWLMLAAGAAGVLGAVGVGYGLARLLRRKEPEE